MSYTVNAAGYGVVVTSEDRFGRRRSYSFIPGEGALQPTADGYTSGVLKALWQTGHVVNWAAEDIRGPVEIDDPRDVDVRDTTEANRIHEFL